LIAFNVMTGASSMKVREMLLALCAVLIVAPAAWASVPLKDYKGPDAGQLILSFADGAYPGPYANISFRRVGARDGDWFTAHNGSLFSNNSTRSKHFDSKTITAFTQAGLQGDVGANDMDVYVVSLPPGDFEIYEVELLANLYPQTFSQTFAEKVIPFHISAGRATYVGALSAVPIQRKGTFGPIPEGWALAFNNQADRDLPIAKAHFRDLGPVDQAQAPEALFLGGE
jgi:hypothetical protein